jgi:flagellar FliL protein
VAKKEDKAPAEVALDGEAPAKPSKKKLIIKLVILIVLLAVLGVGGFFGYKFFLAKKAGGGENATEQKTEEAGGHGEKKAEGGHGEKKDEKGGEAKGGATEGGGELVSLPPLLVNLSEPQGRRYLKLGLDIEVKDKITADQLNKNMSKVKDALLLLLSSKSYEDLASIENKILLKKEIVERLTLVLGEQKVLRVYITEIVVQ